MKLEKITDGRDLGVGRGYDDACGTAHALELIGERWALLVMRELFWGPKRFSDIRAGLPGISANVLTQRLEGLEAAGIVARQKLPPPASVQVYALTAWGRESEPIFQALGRWAARSPRHDPTKPFSTASLLLSLRTMFSPARAGACRARIGLALDDEIFVATIGHGAITIGHDDLAKAEVTLRADAPTVAAAIYGGVPIAELERAGVLTITGARKVLAKFLRLFPLPEKAGP